MKSLFDDNDKYTDEARTLDEEVEKVLRPIVKKYTNLGYSQRDIYYIINAVANTLTLINLL